VSLQPEFSKEPSRRPKAPDVSPKLLTGVTPGGAEKAAAKPADSGAARAVPVVKKVVLVKTVRTLSKPKHMPYGDSIRVWGTVAVVIGHVCDLVLFNNLVGDGDWWILNLTESACRWAVPIYIMLSGALLLDPARNEPASELYRKRLARIGVPIVFWSAFFMTFTYYFGPKEEAGKIWSNLALGKPYAHLHFIFRLAGLYAFTPAIRVFLRYAERRTVAVVVVMLFFLSAANSITEAVLKTELSMFFRFVPFVGFYLSGWLLREPKLTRRELSGCAALAIACVLILAGGTGLLTEHFGRDPFPSLSFLLYDFVSPVRIAMAVAVWLLLVDFFNEQRAQTKFGRFLTRVVAPTTLGLYLAHPFFRDVLALYDIHVLHPWPLWIGIPVVTVLVYVPSFLFVWLLLRMPVVRRIVG
jgi:surface polysaccharide O-acyltransferase-like enzyme